MVISVAAGPADGASMSAVSESPPSSQFAEPTVPKSAAHPLTRAIQAKAQGHQWKRSYRVRVLLVDTIAVVTAVVLASIGRFVLPQFVVPEDDHLHVSFTWAPVAIYSAALVVIWLTALGMQHSRDLTLAGVGAEEYRRVLTATSWVFGIIAAAGLVAREQMARGYLLIAFPVGLIGLLIGRHLLRRHLAKKRAQGKFMNHVVVLGTRDTVVSLCKSFERAKFAGYKVIGACVLGLNAETGDVLETSAGQVPVWGDESSVEEALRLTNADALAVAAVEHLGHEHVRRLAWRLEPLRVDMIIMPGMMDIAGPRLKVRPIDNLPLFHIARPRHDSNPSKYGKRLFDLAFATVAMVLVIPILVAIAIAIKLDDGGPVFFTQERPGHHGKRFRIIKFRTMSVGSERITAGLAAAGFFDKPQSDSRVTRVGHFLRKTSLDELPQLFNVLAGSMSIVGPRPVLLGEGQSVDHYLDRIALVKPGITGLWQISGRSDVSAEERVRLDCSYVDNWSCAHDMVIVLRTVRSVLKRHGAY
jgi:exopolysaccharide biosynthesis polyprenyl glycosylphosphotransferase